MIMQSQKQCTGYICMHANGWFFQRKTISGEMEELNCPLWISQVPSFCPHDVPDTSKHIWKLVMGWKNMPCSESVKQPNPPATTPEAAFLQYKYYLLFCFDPIFFPSWTIINYWCSDHFVVSTEVPRNSYTISKRSLFQLFSGYKINKDWDIYIMRNYEEIALQNKILASY